LHPSTALNNIDNELIIGLAGGLGVDFGSVAATIGMILKQAGYHIEEIRIASNFAQRGNPSDFAQCYWKMQYGTKQRLINGNNYWAKKVIAKIFNLRPELSQKHKKIAYIVRSLKNKDELELLSNVYGRNFISVSVFSDDEASIKFLDKKLKLKSLSIVEAQKQMQAINSDLQFGADLDIHEVESLYLDASDEQEATNDQAKLIRFLISKDQEETHPELKDYGQNLFKCYSIANFFVYQNLNLERQIKRFANLLFNYPFAEPTFEEYFMFCAQAAAYRSLDLDRQVGAVIVNSEHELVASGFNDVCKVGGGHFSHHDHPMHPVADQKLDQRDFRQQADFNHKYLDQIASKISNKLHLQKHDEATLRQAISGVTEFKRSTHAEMSALLDACRRGVPVRDCIMYVNFYPCHNCTKHLIAAGIKKVVFLHPYTKSKARQMFNGMIKHGLFVNQTEQANLVVYEPFLGVSPNRFMLMFANDKDTRLEKENGKETGKILSWKLDQNSIPRGLIERQPHSYIPREWAVINNHTPDMSEFYDKH
jgi:deoxycytidylate deaminase